MVKHFNLKEDVVLIDDAHKFVSTSNGRRFLYRLQTNVKFVILVSSEPLHRDITKELLLYFNLYELPHY